MEIFNLEEILNPSTTITYQKVIDCHNISPKRICFKSCHSNALKTTNSDSSNVKWALFIPFDNTIKKLFEDETNLQIYKTKAGKFWCPIKTEEDYGKALELKKNMKRLSLSEITLICHYLFLNIWTMRGIGLILENWNIRQNITVVQKQE